MGVVACPKCESRLKISEQWQGRKIRCRACGVVFVVGGGPAGGQAPSRSEPREPGIRLQPVLEESAPTSRRSEIPSSKGKQWEVGETVPLSGGSARKPRPPAEVDPPARLSPVAMGLCFLPAIGAISLMAIGGALGGGLGGAIAGGLVTANLAICRRERWPAAARYASVLAIGFLSNAIILGTVFFVLLHASGEKPTAANPPSPRSTTTDRRGPAAESTGPYGQPDGAAFRSLLDPLDRTVDPVGDCRIAVDGSSAEIDVPGTFHDLVRRPGETRFAPRAFRTVEGDFFVKVTVPAYEPPRDPPAENSSVAYHGAGLYVVGDDGRSIRLERASFERGGVLNTYFLASLQVGESPSGEQQQSTADDATYYLFLERRDGELVTGISTDNVNWATSPPMDFPARRVDVGIAAVNTASRPLKARFRDIQIRVP